MQDKHKLTKEEILFLKELSHEMNTQDTVGQAAPRFWVIAQSKEIPTAEAYADGWIIFDQHACEEVSRSVEDALRVFKAEYALFDYMPEDGGWKVVKINEDWTPQDDDAWQYDAYENITDPEELVYFINEWFDNARYEVCFYSKQHENVSDTMFITKKSCEDHIRKYGYNYKGDAHSYAMTAYRSPEVEKLWKILEDVDWDEVLQTYERCDDDGR